MPAGAENRYFERYQLTAAIKLASSKSAGVVNATIINCSEGGAYLEADTALKPGASVFIAGENDSKFFRAKVIWRRKLSRSAIKNFGVGIQYLDPMS
jgi:mannose-6-phosphate isomerase class I